MGATTQHGVTPTVRESRKLTDEHHEVVDEAARWAAEWSKPKTLREIHALVGRFPFKAKVVAAAGEKAWQVGSVVEFTAEYDQDSYRPGPPIPGYRTTATYCDIARWVLVED